MDLNRELRIEQTKQELYQLRVNTLRRFRRLHGTNKTPVLNLVKELSNTRDVDLIDTIVDKINRYLRLDRTPLDVAWERRYNAFYGYRYCLYNGWAVLFELVGV